MSASIESMNEWDQPSPAPKRFCRHQSTTNFEQSSNTATSKALKELVTHLNDNPETYRKVLRRKRQEELESSGPLSFIKARFMSAVHGEQHKGNIVTDSELQENIKQLTTGISKTFEYAQETKVRRSDRIASRVALGDMSSDVNSPASALSKQRSAVQMRPPPPPPLPPCFNVKMSKTKRKTAHLKKKKLPCDVISALATPPSIVAPRFRHTGSVLSIQDEIAFIDHRQRLRPVTSTPRDDECLRTPQGLRAYAAETPLHKVLMRVLENKFRNARSPSPRASPDCSGSADFSY